MAGVSRHPARRISERAEEDYEFTKRLVRKGYETPSDLESKRIAVKREELELQKAQEDLKVLD